MKIRIPSDEIANLCIRLETLASRYAEIKIEPRVDSGDAGRTLLIISPRSEKAARMQISIESDFGAYLSFGAHSDIEVPFPTGYETGLPWDQEVLTLCSAVVAFGMVEEIAFQNNKAVGGNFTIRLENGDTVKGGWVWRIPLALRFGKRIERIYYSAYNRSEAA